jgi:DNA-binding response OmpR family regulator
MDVKHRQYSALIVEDDSNMSEIIGTILENQDISTTATEDFISAQKNLKTGNYDLLMTDLNLPDGDGRDLIRGSRSLSTLKNSLKISPIRKQCCWRLMITRFCLSLKK